MEIDRIFVLSENEKLLSVKWLNHNEHEFKRLFQGIWIDTEYLFRYLNDKKEEFDKYTDGKLPDVEAVLEIIDESEEFEQHILEKANEGESGDLSSLFTQLDKINSETELELSKAYGNDEWSFIRLYAIRIRENTYLITGGGIKVTPTMKDDTDLRMELQKLEYTRNYLLENGVFSEDELSNGYIYLTNDDTYFQ